MGNTHPAHALARMLEHWSLYVLMWAWKNEAALSRPPTDPVIPAALDIGRWAIAAAPAFFRSGRSAPVHGREILLLGGPIELAPESDEATVGPDASGRDSAHWFFRTFSRFVSNAYAKVPAWRDVLDKAPSATELADAFSSRPALTGPEAARRLEGAQRAIAQLRSARLHPSVNQWPWLEQGRPLSRANWETIAALTAWLSRWRPRFAATGVSGDVHISIPGHRVSLLATWAPSSESSPALEREVDVMVVDKRFDDIGHRAAVAPSVPSLAEQLKGDRPDLWIETPSAFLSRARERQHALWASQAGAISNLLARHSRSDRPVGPDRFEAKADARPECEEADHLLRGYGGRVCQYLLQMARADVVTIAWLDYSVHPPRLRHVGGADRLIQHRAERQRRYELFSADEAADTAGKQRAYQLYRAVDSATIQPSPQTRLVQSSALRGEIGEFFDRYQDPKPLDAISVPLLVHGRVVGAFSLSGVNSRRQFDLRLYTPLRLVAQHLAQAMAMQSQLWHMRRLNWLASHRPLDEWRRHDSENRFNPLGPVAETLANIFLCPVVHIWLRDAQNDSRFKLHGYTRSDLLALESGPLTRAPSFIVERQTPAGPVPLSRHFAAFAVDQWTQGSSATAIRQAGSFVQARHSGMCADEASPDFDPTHEWPPLQTTVYSLEAAETGTLVLTNDFLTAPGAPDYRSALFGAGRLHQCMAFAMVDSSEPGAKPDGVVGLYASASSLGDNLLPWPTEWRPIVAHVQSYLPYLLMQTEAIANPLERMRRYLLHEGRNELNHVAATAWTLRTGLKGILAVDPPDGIVRPWLRSALPELGRLAKGLGDRKEAASWLSNAERALDQLQKLLERTSELSSHLISGEFSENLAVMARLIGNQRSLSKFDPNDPDFDHATDWFSPAFELQGAFESYHEVWRALNVQPDLDGLPDDLEFLTSRRFWNLLTRDLVHNIAKYALPNEPIRIAWTRPQRRDVHPTVGVLRLSNFASFAEALDRPERLGTYGVKGSAGLALPRALGSRVAGLMREGQGIGLWGSIEIGKVLDMPLSIEVKPRNETVALYAFNISVPMRLVRHQHHM